MSKTTVLPNEYPTTVSVTENKTLVEVQEVSNRVTVSEDTLTAYVSLVGAQGAPGGTILYGTGDPTESLETTVTFTLTKILLHVFGARKTKLPVGPQNRSSLSPQASVLYMSKPYRHQRGHFHIRWAVFRPLALWTVQKHR